MKTIIIAAMAVFISIMTLGTPNARAGAAASLATSPVKADNNLLIQVRRRGGARGFRGRGRSFRGRSFRRGSVRRGRVARRGRVGRHYYRGRTYRRRHYRRRHYRRRYYRRPYWGYYAAPAIGYYYYGTGYRCRWLRRKWRLTGSRYWRRRYYRCMNRYYW